MTDKSQTTADWGTSESYIKQLRENPPKRSDYEQEWTPEMIRMPYPPNRVCPECGETVGRYDGMLHCKRECPRNELARYDLEREADER